MCVCCGLVVCVRIYTFNCVLCCMNCVCLLCLLLCVDDMLLLVVCVPRFLLEFGLRF